MRCFYLNYTFEYLVQAHQKGLAFNAADHAAKPNETVLVCANKQSDKQLYGFLARAKQISNHGVGYYISEFHRPHNTTTIVEVLTDVVLIPSSVCGDLCRAGIPNKNKQRTFHFLQQHIHKTTVNKPLEIITISKAQTKTEPIAVINSESKPKIKSSKNFVYIIKHKDLDTLYKIGITDNLLRRMPELDVPGLAVIIGHWKSTRSTSFEAVLHKMFKPKVVPGTEWFNLNNDELNQAFHILNSGADLITDPKLLKISKPAVVFVKEKAAKPVVIHKQEPVKNQTFVQAMANPSQTHDSAWIYGSIFGILIIFCIAAAASASPLTIESNLSLNKVEVSQLSND